MQSAATALCKPLQQRPYLCAACEASGGPLGLQHLSTVGAAAACTDTLAWDVASYNFRLGHCSAVLQAGGGVWAAAPERGGSAARAHEVGDAGRQHGGRDDCSRPDCALPGEPQGLIAKQEIPVHAYAASCRCALCQHACFL